MGSARLRADTGDVCGRAPCLAHPVPPTPRRPPATVRARRRSRIPVGNLPPGPGNAAALGVTVVVGSSQLAADIVRAPRCPQAVRGALSLALGVTPVPTRLASHGWEVGPESSLRGEPDGTRHSLAGCSGLPAEDPNGEGTDACEAWRSLFAPPGPVPVQDHDPYTSCGRGSTVSRSLTRQRPSAPRAPERSSSPGSRAPKSSSQFRAVRCG